MKKTITIILALIYLVLVSGIMLQLHYCGGKFSSFSISFKESPKCVCGSKSMKKGCCKNQTVCIQVKGDQQNSTTIVIPDNSAKNIALDLPHFSLISPLVQSVSLTIDYHAPPPRFSNSLLIFNSSFRI